MNDWCFFSERKPVIGDAPFIACRINNSVSLFDEYPGREIEIWHDSWLAWRSIGPLPKAPVDEGERLANEYVKGMGWARESYTQDDFRQVAGIGFMAGYAAGLKKGNG